MMKFDDTVILVFAKSPVAGQVNTRLIPAIGRQAATQLQHDLLHQRLLSLYTRQLCDVVLMCAPDIHHQCFYDCRDLYHVSLVTQSGCDLGQRMANGISQALVTKSHVIVIGTDAPSLSTGAISQAISYLHESADIVIAPAEDGGYVLIGVKQDFPVLFETIGWGSACVLQQTREKINALGLLSKEIAPCWDIDSFDDFQRYLQLCE